MLQKAVHSAATVRIENRLIRSDGSQCWIEWSIVPRRGLLNAVGRDVTERRREQDELRQAQRTVEASRDELSVLARQQAALRRVATSVARGASPSEVFSAVADEMWRCLDTGNASVNRFEDGEVVVLALSHLDTGIEQQPIVGERHTLEGDNIATRVLRTGHAARIDGSELQKAPGSIATRLREMGLRSTVAVPIVVERCSTDEITEQHLVGHAQHASTGLRSAEDEALEALPDNNILAAMKSLPEQFRMVVYYADVEGFRCSEIAQIMATPDGTVLSRLHRGRKQLRTLLTDG